jgi:hypothetical protein
MAEISEEVEAAAWRTALVRSVIFTESGRRRRNWPYLAFRALDQPSGKTEFLRLRRHIQASPTEKTDFEIGGLLQSVDWRLHGIAAVALLVSSHRSEVLLQWLWRRLHSGSAVAPALCASASMVDPSFVEKSHLLLEDPECFFGTVVAIDALLQSVGPIRPYGTSAIANIAEATSEDQRFEKRSGTEAIYWREDASLCLAAA